MSSILETLALRQVLPVEEVEQASHLPVAYVESLYKGRLDSYSVLEFAVRSIKDGRDWYLTNKALFKALLISENDWEKTKAWLNTHYRPYFTDPTYLNAFERIRSSFPSSLDGDAYEKCFKGPIQSEWYYSADAQRENGYGLEAIQAIGTDVIGVHNMVSFALAYSTYAREAVGEPLLFIGITEAAQANFKDFEIVMKPYLSLVLNSKIDVSF